MSDDIRGTSRIPLVLDLDTGIDDALALAYALGSPEVELVGVVSSYGNVTMETAARNTCALLELLGRPDVSVYLGLDRPAASAGPFSPPPGVVRIHGENGLGGAVLPCGCRTTRQNGVDFIASAGVMRHRELCYVPTGPLTNLAAALRRSPGLASRLPRVTFMGGALTVPGNVTPCAEANVHNDPEAADAVLRSGLRTRMVGLDVTHQAILTREEAAAWRELGAAGRLFAQMADYYIGIYEKNNPRLGGCALHDPLAVAAAIDPTLVRCLPANLCVDLAGPTRGRTVCDPARLRDAEKCCDVALGVDVPRFLGEFRTRVRRALGGR